MTAPIFGLLAAVFLYATYHTIGSKWPEAYMSVRTRLESFERGSGVRYVLFRYLPTYLVSCFLSVTVIRLGGNASIAIACMLIAYLAVTDGRAIWRALSETSGRRIVLLAHYIFNILLVNLAAWIGLFTSPLYTAIVPPPDELLSAVWTAAFVAVIATIFLRVLTGVRLGEISSLDSAQNDIGREAWEYIPKAARAYDCDPHLMMAIISAEVQQRPRWVRKIERLKGRIWGTGTYGVAQVAATEPISDTESIDALCCNYAGYYPVRGSGGWIRQSLLEARLEEHNPDPRFVEQIVEFYHSLIPWPMYGTEWLGHDGRPALEVLSAKRLGQEFEIQGTLAASEIEFHAVAMLNESVILKQTFSMKSESAVRGDWSILVPLVADEVRISAISMDESEPEYLFSIPIV